MVERVDIGSATLYLGDCRDVLADLDPVDHVVTDPPYEFHMHHNRGTVTRNDGQAPPRELGFAAIGELREDVTPRLMELCEGWSLIFSTVEGVAAWRDTIEAAGARYKRALPWVKTTYTPQFNGQGPAHCLEMIVGAWAGRGVSRWNGGGKSGEYRGPRSEADRDGRHATEKPLWLMGALLVDFTRAGETILDPFAGSGTTGVQCLRLGRRFIGVEIEREYFDIACDRLDREAAQGNLFDEPMFQEPLQV